MSQYLEFLLYPENKLTKPLNNFLYIHVYPSGQALKKHILKYFFPFLTTVKLQTV